MNKFLMICYVAADFIGSGNEKFRITADKIGVFVEAPEWIKSTLLYKLLLKDGSIRVSATTEEQKKLENDPMENVAADGKEVKEDTEEIGKVVKTRKAPAKKKG